MVFYRKFLRCYRFVCLSIAAGLSPLAQAASDITISTSATSGGAFSGGDPDVFIASDSSANVQASAINSALTANKAVQISTASGFSAPGDLSSSASLSKTGAGSASLTLQATRDLTLGGISSTTGQLALNLTAGRNLTLGSGISSNGANITLDAGGLISLGASNAVNAGAGAIHLASGTLSATATPTLTAGAGFTAAAGTTLATRATVAGPAGISGTLSPAGANAAGTFQVNGALTLAPTATTIIELGGASAGTSYDRVTASGAVTLAGALQVSLFNNYHDTIAPNTTFTIVQGASITGTFAGLPDGSRYTLPGDLGSLRINYTATSVTLTDWQPVITDLTWDPGTA